MGLTTKYTRNSPVFSVSFRLQPATGLPTASSVSWFATSHSLGARIVAAFCWLSNWILIYIDPLQKINENQTWHIDLRATCEPTWGGTTFPKRCWPDSRPWPTGLAERGPPDVSLLYVHLKKQCYADEFLLTWFGMLDIYMDIYGGS